MESFRSRPIRTKWGRIALSNSRVRLKNRLITLAAAIEFFTCSTLD
ncbi:MAG: hypothetical protein LBN38_02150 [Verrucomicrobiota bacterium]|jgi:hypothetical protein|nr:hypothetical protein [Verrucomicrobiota bacterium]